MSDFRVTESGPLLPVTVVIPVYNLAAYLTDAVECVIAQDYQGTVFIIILDDGSSDNSLVVARDLAIKYNNLCVETQQNQGRAAARNKLLDLAGTEIVAWLDGDDLASPQWLSDQISYLAMHADCVAVGGHGYAMMRDGLAIGPLIHPLEAEDIDRQHISGHPNVFFQSCVTVRKSAVLEAGSYDLRYPCAEDYGLWLRLSEVGKLANVDRFHLYYRVHSTSANWTVNLEQRTQGHEILNEARSRRRLPPVKSMAESIPSSVKDDWNRRLYWINFALKSGNPMSSIFMLGPAMRRHPFSLVLWVLAFVSVCDAILFLGNTVTRFVPAKKALLEADSLPYCSCYRLGRAINRARRRLIKKC